jgi:hypothetical protein
MVDQAMFIANLYQAKGSNRVLDKVLQAMPIHFLYICKTELGMNECMIPLLISMTSLYTFMSTSSKTNSGIMHLLWMRLQPSFLEMVQMVTTLMTSFCIESVVHFSTSLSPTLPILPFTMSFFFHMETVGGMLEFLCTMPKLPMRVKVMMRRSTTTSAISTWSYESSQSSGTLKIAGPPL